MKSLMGHFLLAMLCIPTAKAQSTAQTIGKTQMVHVAADVRLIEEKSLSLDSSLQASIRPGSRANVGLVSDGRASDNGLNTYRFTLAAGETINTHIQSDLGDIITQKLGNLSGPGFTPSVASISQIARVNRLSRQQRATKITYKNLEDRPFPLLLVVYGEVGHPLKIVITRN